MSEQLGNGGVMTNQTQSMAAAITTRQQSVKGEL